jgi:hypothetical protein
MKSIIPHSFMVGTEIGVSSEEKRAGSFVKFRLEPYEYAVELVTTVPF